MRYEAEAATRWLASVASDHPGFSGSGFVDYANVSGSYVEWQVTVPAAGPVTLAVRYANGTGDGRPMDLSVGGVRVRAGWPFPATGGWAVWVTQSVTVTVGAGTTRIRLAVTTGNGGPNVDYLEVRA